MYEIKEPRKATSKQSKHCSPRDYSTYRSRQSIELECALERQTSRKIRLPKLLNLYLLDYHVFQILDRNMKKEMFQSALVTSPSFLSSFVLPLPSLLGGGGDYEFRDPGILICTLMYQANTELHFPCSIVFFKVKFQ